MKECKYDQEHTLLRVFCDILTRTGFCVRKQDDLISCRVCNTAIPCKELYELLRIKNVRIPEKWSDTCSSCE